MTGIRGPCSYPLMKTDGISRTRARLKRARLMVSQVEARLAEVKAAKPPPAGYPNQVLRSPAVFGLSANDDR